MGPVNKLVGKIIGELFSSLWDIKLFHRRLCHRAVLARAVITNQFSKQVDLEVSHPLSFCFYITNSLILFVALNI